MPNELGAEEGVIALEPVMQGVIIKNPGPKDFILGSATALPYEVELEDGNWEPYKSEPHELQVKHGRDFNGCTNFAATDAIEALEFKKFGVRKNYSERALAILSNQGPNGNWLTSVAEAIRTYGLVPEEMLPWTPDLDTFEKFMSITPEQHAMLVTEGRKWLEKYEFGYEWVYDNFGPGMREALKRSPIFAAGLYASEASKDANGVYQTDLPNSLVTTHAFVLLRQDENGMKVIDDSYATQIKTLAPNFRVPIGLRFHLAAKVTPPVNMYYPPKNSYVSVADTGERLLYIAGDTIMKFPTNGDAFAEAAKRNAVNGMIVDFPAVDVTAAQISHLKRVKPNGQPV